MTGIHSNLNDHAKDLIPKAVRWSTASLPKEMPRLQAVTRLETWHNRYRLESGPTFLLIATC
jgi:hypothetical protein